MSLFVALALFAVAGVIFKIYLKSQKLKSSISRPPDFSNRAIPPKKHSGIDCNTNPATGLPLVGVGLVDTAGNLHGYSNSEEFSDIDEENFEKKWGTLRCNGSACNPREKCSKPERLFCRDVVSQVVPAGYFKGQFPLKLPFTGWRYPDFAIETPEGKRIVVELDGHEAHVKLSSDKFDEQLLRQNAILCAGWTILRFSFKQLENNAEQCRKLLRTATQMSPVFDKNFNNTPVLSGICLNNKCGGTAKRLWSIKNRKLFWKCVKCKKTFNHDLIEPVPQTLQ